MHKASGRRWFHRYDWDAVAGMAAATAALKEAVSFILADRESDGKLEAQLSFWGEPFMAAMTLKSCWVSYAPQ